MVFVGGRRIFIYLMPSAFHFVCTICPHKKFRHNGSPHECTRGTFFTMLSLKGTWCKNCCPRLPKFNIQTSARVWNRLVLRGIKMATIKSNVVINSLLNTKSCTTGTLNSRVNQKPKETIATFRVEIKSSYKNIKLATVRRSTLQCRSHQSMDVRRPLRKSSIYAPK